MRSMSRCKGLKTLSGYLLLSGFYLFAEDEIDRTLFQIREIERQISLQTQQEAKDASSILKRKKQPALENSKRVGAVSQRLDQRSPQKLAKHQQKKNDSVKDKRIEKSDRSDHSEKIETKEEPKERHEKLVNKEKKSDPSSKPDSKIDQEKKRQQEFLASFQNLSGPIVQSEGSSLLNIRTHEFSKGPAILQTPLEIKGTSQNHPKNQKDSQTASKGVQAKKIVLAKAATEEDLKKQEKQFYEKFLSTGFQKGDTEIIQKADQKKEGDFSSAKNAIDLKSSALQKPVEILQIKTQEADPKPVELSDKNNQDEKNRKDGKTTASEQETEGYKSMPVSVVVTQDSPKLQFSGDFCAFLGGSSQDDTRDFEDGDPHFGFGWADLCMEISSSFLKNLQVTYKIKLEVVPDSVAVNQNYFEIQSDYGTFQMGNVRGPEHAFTENGVSLLGGTGGVDGSCFDMFNKVPGLPNFVYQAGSSKYATKFVYYTARFLGIQLGLGFCPNPTHMGWGQMGSKDYDPGIDPILFSSDIMRRRMNWSFGLSYEQSVDDFCFKAALTAVKEKATLVIPVKKELPSEYTYDDSVISYALDREVPLKNDTSYQASTSVTYKDFQIAAGFINNGSLNLPYQQEGSDLLEKYGLHLGDCGKSWNIGGKYTVGCVDLGLAYNKVRRRITGYDYAKGQVTTFTVDCQVVSGIKLFAELEHIKCQADERAVALYGGGAPAKNSGMTLLVGSKLSF